MANSLRFYHDSSLYQEVTAENPIVTTQSTIGVGNPMDYTVYLGSPAVGTRFLPPSPLPQIVVSIVDADSGSGEPAHAVKLALSTEDLDVAEAGADLQVGAEILSGQVNAVPIYLRLSDTLGVVGVYADISLVAAADEYPLF